MNSRNRFLAACGMTAVDRPPIWLMRQAGRSLPEYALLKEKHGFHGLLSDPELAAEVTIQPIARFGFDAAIIFSDILVVPAAMGQSFEFVEGKGIRMPFTVRTRADIERLRPADVDEKLGYLFDAISLVRCELGADTALLGFSGSPWSLANFMVEGGSAREFTAAKALFHEDPGLYTALMEKICDGVVRSLRKQIDAGADAVQIFDSFGHTIPPHLYHEVSGRWIRRIVDELATEQPVILFRRGAFSDPLHLIETGATVFGLDFAVSLADVRKLLPGHPLQGNLDPAVLLTSPDAVRREALLIIETMRGENGFIFNLGHGVPPGAKLECIQALVDAVRA